MKFDSFEDKPFNEYFIGLSYQSSNLILTIELLFFMLLINFGLLVLSTIVLCMPEIGW